MSASKWKPYPEYKKTDIEWIPKIPTNWKAIPAKRIFQNSKQLNKGLQSIERLSLTMNGVIERPIDDASGLQPTEFETYQIFEENDLVFKLIDLENIKTSRVGIVPKKGIMSPAYIRILKNLSHDMRYFYFQYFDLYLRNILNDIGSAGVRSNISAPQLLELPIIVPSTRNEEAKISQFCDSVNSIFSKMKQSLESLLQVLEEKRSALITQVVTKGLNANVPMKNSGIEQTGDVPEHWNLTKLKYLVTESVAGPYGSSLTKAMYTSEGYRVYGQQQVIPDNFCKGDYYISEEKFREMSRFQVHPGDILVSVMGTIGKVAVVPDDVEKGIINPRLVRYRPDFNRVSSRFLQLTMNSESCQSQLLNTANGSTMDGLNMTTLGRLNIPLPPISEQIKIIEYLSNISLTIDGLLELISHKIEIIKTYQAALNSAAVTGKIDVRGLA